MILQHINVSCKVLLHFHHHYEESIAHPQAHVGQLILQGSKLIIHFWCDFHLLVCYIFPMFDCDSLHSLCSLYFLVVKLVCLLTTFFVTEGRTFKVTSFVSIVERNMLQFFTWRGTCAMTEKCSLKWELASKYVSSKCPPPTKCLNSFLIL